MCKEDVRIKRKTAYRTYNVGEVGTAYQVACPANPDRVALIVAYGANVTTLTDSPYLKVAGPKFTTDNCWGVVTAYQGTQTWTIEQLGSLLTEQVYVAGSDGSADFAIVTEVYFLQELGDV